MNADFLISISVFIDSRFDLIAIAQNKAEEGSEKTCDRDLRDIQPPRIRVHPRKSVANPLFATMKPSLSFSGCNSNFL
jgi:hypothetical protein